MRYTKVRMLNYCATESWQLLCILSCPVATTCEKQVFFKNLKNNNHNLIKKLQAIAFFQRTILQCILQNTDITINI